MKSLSEAEAVLSDQRLDQTYAQSSERPHNRFAEWLRILNQKRKLVSVAAAAGAFLGIVYCGVAPRQYLSGIVIAPVPATDITSPSIQSPLSSLLQGSSDDEDANYRRFLLVLQSYAVAEKLAADPDVMHRMFPHLWNAASQEWHPPAGLLWHIRYAIGRTLEGWPHWKAPDAQDVLAYLNNRLEVSRVGRGPARNLVVQSQRPKDAEIIVGKIFAAATEQVRNEQWHLLGVQIDNITEQFKVVQIAEVRAALGDVLSNLMRNRALMNEHFPAGAMLLQKPISSRSPVSPNAPRLVLLGALLGAALGSLYVLLRNYFVASAPE